MSDSDIYNSMGQQLGEIFLISREPILNQAPPNLMQSEMQCDSDSSATDSTNIKNRNYSFSLSTINGKAEDGALWSGGESLSTNKLSMMLCDMQVFNNNFSVLYKKLKIIFLDIGSIK